MRVQSSGSERCAGLLALALLCASCGGGQAAQDQSANTPPAVAATTSSPVAAAQSAVAASQSAKSPGRAPDAVALEVISMASAAAPDQAAVLDIPVLTGTPANVVVAGESYDFMPLVLNAPLSALSFSIVNKPDWATFNPATGELTGAPAPAQVGIDSDIVITASYAQGTAALAGFSIQVLPPPPANRSVTISWTPPAANTDGSALTDLAGYRIYYQRFDIRNWGAQQSLTVADPKATRSVLQGLLPGTYTLCITAYNASNVESDPTFYASTFVL
jgi:hypothetical protein